VYGPLAGNESREMSHPKLPCVNFDLERGQIWCFKESPFAKLHASKLFVRCLEQAMGGKALVDR